MDRRNFLKTTGSLVSATAFSGAGLEAATRRAAGRLILPLNRNWLYSRTPVDGAHEKDFDDAGFERVVLPHANIRLPWHGFEDKAYQFVSIYRRHFRLPPAARGRRVFVDFEGVMTASTVWLNGVRLGEYRGGFTPFGFDLTPHVDLEGENVLVVEVDSTERPDIPPFGQLLDYLTFGGIYREVSLKLVAASFLENVFARPMNVMAERPGLEVDCSIQHLEAGWPDLVLELDLVDGERVIARTSGTVEGAGRGRALGQAQASSARDPESARPAELQNHTARFEKLPPVRLWELDHPNLYTLRVRLLRNGRVIDSDSRSFGFRAARFTDHGFELNGRIVKLRGLNRHQTFPFVGPAMPRRVQRRDAEILRKELKCNIVRTSHYPQSRHFLDACDELGLLVLEEIPGWQHIGDASWKDLAVDNVRRMIRRDWNHPSIVLWGVRINESGDDHDFYIRTNGTAHELDPTRQTGGIRAFRDSELLEDVFTVNDFGFPLQAPNHPRYLNTEFIGHTYDTKTTDDADRLIEHTLRHARVHDQLASDPRYAGGIAWCAFDYNTHANFGSGDRICYHGVADIFREPKRAAGFYRSQCDPAEEVVVEPALHWAAGDEAGGLSRIVVCSNCDHLKLFLSGKLLVEGGPDRKQFPHLVHPPFVFTEMRMDIVQNWGDLRIEGYIGGRQVVVRTWSGLGVDQKFDVTPDDPRLLADGADATRLVLRVSDEFGNVRPYAADAIRLEFDGPAALIGENPCLLIGGIAAVWIRATETPGTVRIKAIHPRLGERSTRIEILPAPAETV
ncbi:MAG: Beta-galactosidase [Gammaproteobacteria bacterium]|nr:Beta-galactosidase [Gammaproteobacteria bacterium]